MPGIISDCVQISVRGTQPTGQWANVFHFIELGTPSGDTEALAQDFVQIYCNNLRKALTAQVTIVDAAYVDLSSVTGDSGVVAPTTGPYTGGQSGFGAPMNVAMLINWGAAGSRSQRNGRTY